MNLPKIAPWRPFRSRPRPGPETSGNPQAPARRATHSLDSGIALVVTLLMLSIITFLAIAFLVLTRGHGSSVALTIDQNTAQEMSEAAVARAKSEIIARMMAQGDLLSYDYMASSNYINSAGFASITTNDVNNVNYDKFVGGNPMSSTAFPAAWAQNIANLAIDPRAPVFIKTNSNPNFPADFRFWVDVNRNGRFETNGYMLPQDDNGNPAGTNFFHFDGEPEWIGVLQYPEFPHSSTNRFIGRYAYLVSPIGKTLDLNYIHNYAKSILGGSVSYPVMPAQGAAPQPRDGFLRSQGVGSWELNLAAFLTDLDQSNYYNPQFPSSVYYHYLPDNTAPNSGIAFDDAYSYTRFRYGGNYGNPYPLSLFTLFGAGLTTTPIPATVPIAFGNDGIDEYSTGAAFPFDFTTATDPDLNHMQFPWPGGYTTNAFFDVQDLFDTNKVSANSVNRLMASAARTNSYQRYAFQRLLATIGTGAAPELQTYVYDDVTNAFIPGTPPVWLYIYNDHIATNLNLLPTRVRPKVNLNYDNSFQITNNLNASPTVLSNWTALAFFTNAAESLVRSQNFTITNSIGTNPVSLFYIHFGITNIPVYNSTNSSVRYSENLHRMLQLAANIYDDTVTSNSYSPSTVGPAPHVFRPLFFTTNTPITSSTPISARLLYIVGYTEVANLAADGALSRPFKDPSDPTIRTNDNVWGIPWVVGAVKGLPSFNRYSYENSVMVTRKIQFLRSATNVPPYYTNQFYIMSVSNAFGLDAWNSYQANFTRPVRVVVSNYVSVTLINTNEVGAGFSNNLVFGAVSNVNGWPGAFIGQNPRQQSGLKTFLQTSLITLPPSYFSESLRRFVPVFTTNDGLTYTDGAFQPSDKAQRLSTTGYPVHGWKLNVTNRVLYLMLDTSPGPTAGRVLDFVNLGPFGTSLDVTNELNLSGSPVAGAGGYQSGGGGTNMWNPSGATDFGGISAGMLSQIQQSENSDPLLYGILQPGPGLTNDSEGVHDCSTNPASVIVENATWEVNDPLVHYTLGDLVQPPTNNDQILPSYPLTLALVPLTTTVGSSNPRYEPWPGRGSSTQNIGANTTLKDPQIYGSDSWNFPTNKFPGVGWLGRVHRGTPWQTIFLKADTNYPFNAQSWVNQWVSTLDTYPTNDYALPDLFTATPNDNAATGLLSVNQANSAPWYALFAGVSAYPSNDAAAIIDPTNVDFLINGGIVGTNYIPGIFAMRSLEPNQVYHKLGDILKAPTLTLYSPMLGVSPNDCSDEVVERIPQQILSLLQVGQPRFVIYGYGQALKPAGIPYFGSPNFNLCTNYQITGEFVTRTVCHVVGDPFATNPKIEVDSFNILPGN